jgi:hypothetical protein
MPLIWPRLSRGMRIHFENAIAFSKGFCRSVFAAGEFLLFLGLRNASKRRAVPNTYGRSSPRLEAGRPGHSERGATRIHLVTSIRAASKGELVRLFFRAIPTFKAASKPISS